MSIRLTQLVWKNKINLMPTEKFVLLFLAHCANDKNNCLCFPSVKTISENCNLSKRHTQRILRTLSELKIIQCVPQLTESNNQKSNIYIINTDVLSSEVGVTPASWGGDAGVMGGVTPMSPYNINDKELDNKETKGKKVESESSAAKNHPSSVLRSTAKLVIDFLRQKTGRNYRYAETTLKPIIQRLKEGITLEQCKQVIVRKHREWGSNKEMEKYLRPSTLFNKSNFYDKYLPEVVTADEKKNIMQAI